MCLTTLAYPTNKEALHAKNNPLIANKDIKVYKVLTKRNQSPFMYFEFEKGQHYYQTGRAFNIRMKKRWSNYIELEISRGLHACLTKRRALSMTQFNNRKIVIMYIPKGAKYFISEYGNEIVSDQLIWY